MLNQETKRRIDSARDILVGKIPDPKAQVEQITTALIYKFMDDMDKESEELGGKARFFVNEYAKYGWSKLLDPRLGGYDRLNLYSEALLKMPQNPNLPQLFRNILKDAYLPYRDPETLNLFLKEINGFTYDHSEKLGDAFEYLLSVLGSQGDAGQFRTPRHIIDFIVAVVDPKKDETILDPACGTAGFLISAYKHILHQNTIHRLGDQLTPDERTKLMQHFVGYDISPDMVRLSLTNMYLHSFPNPNVYEYDTLTSEERWDETYDVIIANPPFMSPKGGIRPHKRFSIQANRSEVLFVDYIAEHLTTHGRAGVIVPEGIIFQSGTAYKALRKMLVEKYLYAVVSLPAGVFQPYSGVKTSILLMDKQLAKKATSILFVKVESDGFDLGAQRRVIEKNDLPHALTLLQQYKQSLLNGEDPSGILNSNEVSHMAVIAEKMQIAKHGDYNLSGERYRESLVKQDQKWPMVELGKIAHNLDSRRKPVTKSDRIAGKYPYYGASGIVDYVDDYIFDEDLLLISEDGANLLARNTPIAFSISGKTWVNNHAHVLRFQTTTTQKFVEVLLNAMNLENYITGSAQPKLNQDQLNSIKIPFPPLEIEKEIVAELESYQKVIDGAKQVVENYNVKINIKPEWKVVKLGEISNIIMGQSPLGETYNQTGEGIPLINGPVEFGPTPFSKTIKSKFTTAPTKMCKVNDLILCVRGSTTGRMNIAGFDACVGRGVAAISSEKYQEYINFYISTIQKEIYDLGAGSTFPNVTSQDIHDIKIPLPPLEDQQKIIAQIKRELKLIEGNKKLIEIFEQKIKDKIAEVWGEVDVPKADSLREEVELSIR